MDQEYCRPHRPRENQGEIITPVSIRLERLSDLIPDLATVGVEGSNPLARSKTSHLFRGFVHSGDLSQSATRFCWWPFCCGIHAGSTRVSSAACERHRQVPCKRPMSSGVSVTRASGGTAWLHGAGQTRFAISRSLDFFIVFSAPLTSGARFAQSLQVRRFGAFFNLFFGASLFSLCDRYRQRHRLAGGGPKLPMMN